MKTALIVTGILRNYNAALLSLPIWGECDVYLNTWHSSGKNSIDDYARKVNAKDIFVHNDLNYSVMQDAPFAGNVYRMLHLWEQFSISVPTEYDRYIIIRPDGFYWTNNEYSLREIVQNTRTIKVNQQRNYSTEMLSDHVIICSANELYRFNNCIQDAKYASSLLTGIENKRCVHHILFKMWDKQLEKDSWNTDADICSTELLNVLDVIFVRDTFKYLETDRYNKDLYEAVFYDTASWWRRTTGLKYGGRLRIDL